MKRKKANEISIQAQYEEKNAKKRWVILASAVLMVVMGLWFMTVGVADTSIAQVCAAIRCAVTGELSSGQAGSNAGTYKIILLMRLPRIVMAIAAGVGLSAAGVMMQSITRNPLVSPFTIGISNAAAFGASMYIVFGSGALAGHELGTICSAFFCAVLCAALVYGVAGRVDMGPETLILVGIALNYLFSALTSTIEFFAQEHKLAAVVQWTFGTFNGVTWNETIVVILFTVVCTVIARFFALPLNVMASGEDELVRSLGINPERVRIITGILSVLMTAAVISFTGVIGFVGLVAPHIARMTIGSDHRFLLPFSGVVGAMLLLVADTIGKTILSPVSIPVGIVVSFLGVPLFINLILSKRRGYFK